MCVGGRQKFLGGDFFTLPTDFFGGFPNNIDWTNWLPL